MEYLSYPFVAKWLSSFYLHLPMSDISGNISIVFLVKSPFQKVVIPPCMIARSQANTIKFMYLDRLAIIRVTSLNFGAKIGPYKVASVILHAASLDVILT